MVAQCYKVRILINCKDLVQASLIYMHWLFVKNTDVDWAL